MLKLKSVIDQTKYGNSSFVADQQQQQQQFQLPDHLKCGEVFTWLCAGELYGIECKLCEDHPLCPLSEFPEHMEIWHTEWRDATEGGNNVKLDSADVEEENQNVGNYKNDNDLAFISKNSGFINSNHDKSTWQDQCEKILEPFEQVLIEQDMSINTMHINEDTNEGEDVKAKQYKIENKPKRKQSFNINTKAKYIINEPRGATSEINAPRGAASEIRESERELQCLTEIKENATKHLRNKHIFLKYQIQTKNCEKVLQKFRNYKRNLNKNIRVENSKSSKIKKSIKENLTKIKQIKRTLSKIVRDMNNFKESDQIGNETSENETYKTHYSNITKLKHRKTKKLKTNWRFGKIFKTETERSEMEMETSDGEIETMETEKETIATEKDTSEAVKDANKRHKESSDKEKETNKRKKEQHKTREISNNETDKQEIRKTKRKTAGYDTNPRNLNLKKQNKTEITAKVNKNKNKEGGIEINLGYRNKSRLYKNKKPQIADENDLNVLQHNKTETTTEYFTSLHKTKSFSLNNEKSNKDQKERNKTKKTENKMEPNRNETKQSKIKTKQIPNENQLNEPELQPSIENKTENKPGITEYFESRPKNKSTNSNETETNKRKTLHNENKIETNQQEIAKNGTETYNNDYLNYDGSYLKNIRKSSMRINKAKTKHFENAKETSEIETPNIEFHDCLQKSMQQRKFEVDICLEKSRETIKKLNYYLRNSKIKSKQNENHRKSGKKQYENETEKKENEESSNNEVKDLRKTRKSLRISGKKLKNSENCKQENETKLEVEVDGTNENERISSKVEEDVSQRDLTKHFKDEEENEQEEIEEKFNDGVVTDQKNYQTLELKEKMQISLKSKEFNRKSVSDLYKRNEIKRKLRNNQSQGGEDLSQLPFKRSRKIWQRNNKQMEFCRKRLTIKKALRRKRRSKVFSKIRFSIIPKNRRKTVCEINFEENVSKEFCTNSHSQELSEISLSIAKKSEAKSLVGDEQEKKKEDPLTDSTTIFQENTNNVQTKDKINEKSLRSLNLNRMEINEKSTKQTLITQFFTNKDKQRLEGASNNSENSEKLEHIMCNEQLNLPVATSNKDSCLTPTTQTSTPPFSPKTEEEHFEFYEPKEKLNKQHIRHLIKLYHDHPRLWDQSHPEFCEPQICRKSWQRITNEWNEFCKRNFTIAEVRIRICRLCQRFIQERDRLALEGEVDESAKFPYYEQMQFLEQQKSLQKRRELYDQQNGKILEIYQNFPVLWHISGYKLRKAQERDQAIQSISKTLKLYELHLSAAAVQKRLRSLRKCYRLEKIRHLHAQVEQTHYEPLFLHYERMQFLDKHIDPFVCRICGKILENLTNFRLHLEAESHGSLLSDESETENDLDNVPVPLEVASNPKLDINDETSLDNKYTENELEKEIDSATFVFSPIIGHMEESENSCDILQRFTPFSCSPMPIIETFTNSQSVETPENVPSNIKEVLHFALNTPTEPIINSLHLEDELIEEIIEKESLSLQGLDQFINTVTSCDDHQDINLPANNCVTETILSPKLFHNNNSFVIEHPDRDADQNTIYSSLSPTAESFNTVSMCTETSYIIEHPDIITDENDYFRNPETAAGVNSFVFDLLHTENSATAGNLDFNVRENMEQSLNRVLSPYPSVQEELDHEIKQQNGADDLTTPDPIVVNVQCSDFSVDLKLHPEPTETFNRSFHDSDNELFSSADISTIPLPDHLIHKMIEVYRKFPQLWNPNHLDFNSRTLRREAWCLLTAEFNLAVEKQISWRTLHRKLTDYMRYYKKLIMEQEDYKLVENKWAFYEDFKFLDDVIAVNNELQRSVHSRENNFKIIAIYKTLPQLWDTKHSDYNKRDNKQRNIERMCNKLEEENNLQLTTERLKHRLIELRTQYRIAKKQRLKCIKNKQEFKPDNFEYYEALNFLDDHIDPFICDKCKMEFKKHTDYKQHLKRDHAQKMAVKTRTTSLDCESSSVAMENICHICGIKFTTRSNLMHHVRRHEGIRDYACSMCPKKFYASHALKVHIRSHTKECPYTCEKCGMSFVSASKLNQHVKRHMDKRDFQCDFCSKAFYTAFEKDRHERRHLNIRDKVCPVCGKTFVAGSSYYAHLMLHDDTKRFKCDKCDMKFAQYAGLYKHKKKYHV